MCDLFIIKHLRELSDELIVEKWNKNTHYQYFCGVQELIHSASCASSELVLSHHRIREKDTEFIFQESIRINNEDNDEHHHDTAFGLMVKCTPERGLNTLCFV